ncbi:protein-glutamate methylesterase/protein-glutamine glutaminase [Nocardioides ferulae]|uniref:protein-glutamate methylesterase/protein-glutamine glutaminase n=1 Tax=Nocardioides ferulae TaxID=2340821 RepID=UPI000EB0A26F|nr:chemotaxis response regulator protein-glutamate methylesterase [Nocardioides ferulae]
MQPIRVLVVDDSVVIRRLVTGLLAEDPRIEVVGTAINGRAALQKVAQFQPDLVTMDIEMPEMDGIEAVRRLRASGSRMPIIMFSTLTERGAVATLDALAAGASDYVPKPANVGSVGRSMEQVREALIPRIMSLVPRVFPRQADRPGAVAAPAARAAQAVTCRQPRQPAGGYRLLVIGSSTGGPEAVNTLLASLPPLPVPVALVQHMPPLFTRQFAARLDRQFPFSVVEAGPDEALVPGKVVIAPGDHHLEVVAAAGGFRGRLTQGPPENYCRPAVDVLFRTAAQAAGGAVLSVVLTGMGSDGCKGAKVLVDAGGSVLAQDEATSVVWGMPGAVATAGLTEAVLPLKELAAEIMRRLSQPALRSTGPVPVRTGGAAVTQR